MNRDKELKTIEKTLKKIEISLVHATIISIARILGKIQPEMVAQQCSSNYAKNGCKRIT